MAAGSFVAIIATGLLIVTSDQVFGVSLVRLMTDVSLETGGWLLPPEWSWALINGALDSVGILVAAPLFRWISGIGWKCRCRLVHLFIGATLVIGLIVCSKVLYLNGYITDLEGSALMILILLTIGFGWHVYAMKRAEVRFEADAAKAEIETFA